MDDVELLPSDVQAIVQDTGNNAVNKAALTARERQLAGLRMWKPGQSGNPNGRPKKKPITARYEHRLEQPLPEPDRKKLCLPKGATWGDAIAASQVLQARKGNVLAAKEITDRVEGKVPQAITGEDGEPVQMQIAVVHLGLTGGSE